MTVEKHRDAYVLCPTMHHMNTFTQGKLHSGTRSGRQGEQRKKGLKIEGIKQMKMKKEAGNGMLILLVS